MNTPTPPEFERSPEAASEPSPEPHAPPSISGEQAIVEEHASAYLVRPWVTYALLGIFALLEGTIQILQTDGGGGDLRHTILEAFGQDRVAIWEGEYYRLLTCTFLHGAFWHFAVNAITFLLFGRIVERWLGAWRFLGFYLLFAFGGSLTYQAFSDAWTGVGASGGICGLVGCFLVGRFGKRGVVIGADGRPYGSRHAVLGRRFWIWTVAVTSILILESWFLERRVPGLQVADSAHLGGLLTGLLGGAFFFSAMGRYGARRRIRAGLTAFALLVGLGIYSLAFPVFDSGWYLWRVDRHVVEFGDDSDPDLIASLEERARYFGGDFAALGIIERKLRRERLGEDAWEYWQRRPLDSVLLQLEAGAYLYDRLHATDQGAALTALLDRMIGLTDEALEQYPDSPGILNAGAWYRALRRTDLDKALEMAHGALAKAPLEGAILNTVGWVYFQRREYDDAFKFLIRAVKDHRPQPLEWSLETIDEKIGEILFPDPAAFRTQRLAPNYLYLALAYWDRDDVTDARFAALQARKLVDMAKEFEDPDEPFPGREHKQLEDHELRMLEQLEASLAHGPIRPPVRVISKPAEEDPTSSEGSGAGEAKRVE